MSQSKPMLNSLTSLRFVAAGAIVLGHGHPYFGSLGLATTFSLAQGVSFFFVLSGYILAFNYPRVQNLSELWKFYRARFSRIWPLHLTGTLIFFFLVNGINAGALDGSAQLVFAGASSLLLMQSLIPLRDIYLVFNGVAWSLSTEIVFYLIFPLLILRRGGLSGLIAQIAVPAAFVCAFLLFATGWNITPDEAYSGVSLMGLLYVNPMARLLEFGLGVAACRAFLAIKEKLPSSGSLYVYSFAELAVVLLSLISIYLSPRVISLLKFNGQFAVASSYYLTKSGSACIFALLIIIFSLGKGRISRLLSAGPFILLGEISFALYIVHMGVLQWYAQHRSTLLAINQLYHPGLYWGLCILLAYLMHKGIEEPMRRLLLGRVVNKITVRSVFESRAFHANIVLVLLLAFLKVVSSF